MILTWRATLSFDPWECKPQRSSIPSNRWPSRSFNASPSARNKTYSLTGQSEKERTGGGGKKNRQIATPIELKEKKKGRKCSSVKALTKIYIWGGVILQPPVTQWSWGIAFHRLPRNRPQRGCKITIYYSQRLRHRLEGLSHAERLCFPCRNCAQAAAHTRCPRWEQSLRWGERVRGEGNGELISSSSCPKVPTEALSPCSGSHLCLHHREAGRDWCNRCILMKNVPQTLPHPLFKPTIFSKLVCPCPTCLAALWSLFFLMLCTEFPFFSTLPLLPF